MLSHLARSSSRLAPRAPALTQIASRGMCMTDGIQVDNVARVFSCKVKDDKNAVALDDVFNDYLDKASEGEGVWGAARLVCKSEWDYKLILKFEDIQSLKGYMADHHETLMEEFTPKIKSLIVGDLHQQNFVYDDIDE